MPTAPSTVPTPVLAADGVVKRYGGVVALEGVSIRAAAGECVALVGESGSGKTTLLRCFNRMTTPDAGRVTVEGADAASVDAVQLRRRIGYVQQEGGLLPHWTVLRNASLVPWLRGDADAEAKGAAALEWVGLDAADLGGRWPRELSGGQRQRVAIARALAARPGIVLLDEPFGALDAITRADLQDAFGKLRRELGITALLVTHDLHEAALLADRIAVLRRGRIEQVASPEVLVRAPETEYVAGLVARSRLGGGMMGRILALTALLVILPAPSADAQADARPVVIASKPFAESYLLAEMFAQVLEGRGIAVERRAGLGATEIAFGALRTGAIDVYPEYTGTGLLAILGEPPQSDPAAVFGRVSREFGRRWGVRWLPPLGFQNTYAIAVRRETAERYGLRTLTDLARAAPQLRAGFTPDFIGREDGLPGLRAAYGLRPRTVRPLVQAVKYRALAEGAVDVIDGYSTDGLIDRYGLVVLEDDRGFFPPYQAAALVSARLQRDRPDAVAALTTLSGRLDVRTMRALNRRVEVDGEPVARVAADGLRELGLAGALDRGDAAPAARGGSLGAYLWERRGALARLTGRHLLLVALSLLAAAAVAVPLGVMLGRARAGAAEGTVRAVGVLQTIPGIALLAFMIPLLGIGMVPALAALFLYSLYPIVRNTYTGVRDAGPEAVEAARALGMSDAQVLRHVRLPLAAPSIMAGVRTSAVIAVGTATLAAFIGAGGLGDPIVAGLALSDTQMILSGAIPAALLALLVDAALALAERRVRPRGLG